jgi:alpha-galactosidase
VRFEMMRRLGYFVTESSEHQSEYTPHFIHHGQGTIKKFDIPIDEYLRRCESIISSWKRTEAELIGTTSDIAVDAQTHEYGSFIIHSMETNTPRVIYGNVPNTGLITNLPDRCCVELPVLVDAQGLQPTVIGKLPPQLAAICRTNINVQELTVEAALSGQREYIYHAVMADPHTAATLPLDKIWAMCDDLIEAHQKVGLLGEYAPTIANTGRAYAGTGDKVIVTIEPAQPLSEITGQPIAFDLSATNHSGKAFSGKLSLESSPVSLSVKKGRTSLKVAAGATVTERIVLSPDAAADSLSLRVLSDDVRVLGREYVFNKPRYVPIPKSGQADIEIPFMSNSLLAGQISAKSGQLEITGRIIDTSVRIDDLFPWTASTVELFLRPTGAAQPFQQWFLMPRTKGATVLAPNMEADKRLAFKVAIDKGGYNFTLRTDLVKLGIQKESGDAFYLDLIVTAGALGDAHGACRVGWNGRTDSAVRSDHYALIAP